MPPVRLITWVLAGLIFVISLRVLPTVVGPLVARWRLGPKAQDRPIAAIPGWGDAFDPAGDCTIKGEGTILRIEVPGTLHDLSVEQARVEAPRVLRAVEGDFVADVTVAGAVAPGGGRTASYALPYHGAGLLVWLDRDNYIRLERAAIAQADNLFHYVNLEQRTDAVRASSSGVGTPDAPIALRVERRGSRLTASYRAEGRDWVRLPREMSVRGWGPTLQVGAAAVNTATAPFAAEFRDFRVRADVD